MEGISSSLPPHRRRRTSRRPRHHCSSRRRLDWMILHWEERVWPRLLHQTFLVSSTDGISLSNEGTSMPFFYAFISINIRLCLSRRCLMSVSNSTCSRSSTTAGTGRLKQKRTISQKGSMLIVSGRELSEKTTRFFLPTRSVYLDFLRICSRCFL